MSAERLSFIVLKDPKAHAVTRMGLKVLPTEDRLIVYCTDEGPLDPRYTDQWLQWRRQRAENRRAENRRWRLIARVDHADETRQMASFVKAFLR